MKNNFNQKYLTWDCETEGLNLFFSRPWQLSWQVNCGQKTLEVFDEYIDWPDLVISPKVQQITGFSWDVYNEKKKKPKEVLNLFNKFINNKEFFIVGQNLLFYDVYILGVLQRLCGQQVDYSYMPRIYDTRPLGKACVDGLKPPTNKSDLLSWQYKVINDRTSKTKVSQLTQLKRLGIPFDEHKLHNAVYDNEMCFKIFWELKKKLDL